MIALGASVFLLPAPQAVTAAPFQTAASHDLTVNISEAYLASQVADGLQSAHLPIPLENVLVDLGPDSTLAVSAQTQTPLVKVSLSGLFKLSALNGRLVAQATDIRVGGLAVDRFVGEALEQQVNERLSGLTKDSALDVVAVDTLPDGLAIRAKVR